MVAITIVPARGNAGARYFPHSGHLGLTPVKLDGVVRTRLEEDGKTVLASAVTISLRCYEARVGRVGIVKSNTILEQSQTLWSPSDSSYGPLGVIDLPFKIVLPANAAGNSTFNLQEYRVYWRIEAAIHHMHIPGVGTKQVKCFDVNLARYNKPSTSSLPRSTHSSDAHPSVRCELDFPRQSVAPLDPIPVSLRIHSRHGTSVQRVTFALERRIDMFDATPSTPVTQLPSPPATITRHISREYPSISPCDSSATSQSYSSTTALLQCSPQQERPSSSRKRSPSPASQLLAAKTIEAVLATAEVSEIVTSQVGLCTVNSALQVPLPKSSAHWGVGETMQGGLARMRFFVTAKIQLSVTGSDVAEFCQQEINVVAVDDAERLRVHSKYSTKRPATSPSTIENQKEPRRPVPYLPSPPPSPGLGIPSRSGKASRRPHTASGARDASQRRALPLRPHSRGNEQSAPTAVFGSEQVRAWERELDQIVPAPVSVTSRPRSSSALRIFSSKKQRSPAPEPRPEMCSVGRATNIGVARPVVVPSTRTAEVLEWEAEVERFSSASAREAVLKGHASRAPLSI